MEKTNLKAEERHILICLYFGGVYILLSLILREGFSISRPFATAIAVLISTLSAYPIFIRGTEIRWEKGKQWTFLKWLIICVTPFSILAFIFSSLIDWLM